MIGGADAKVALDWHTRRQMAPHLFTSQLRNKLRYARYGARQLFQGRRLQLAAPASRFLPYPLMFFFFLGGAFNSLLERVVFEADGARLRHRHFFF